ncbi:MAG: hypothetical protein CMF22_08945 [Idiomarinaceae bacterium]|nr:hypothetical protein [Idiomarinaceae bacterium]|tara:strand:- start:26 stop:646 length:621 start_codon:yes stop_codon:yes gene_type:complete
MKTIGKTLLAVSLLAASGASYAGACDAMEAEISAISGAVPKFTENGELHSISMYADATFIAPKRSLIRTARDEAELRAKSELAKFFEDAIARDTLAESLTEQAEKTDGAGNTEAVAVELKRASDAISSSTSAVISGIVKLDECVDTEGKFLIVRMGWKPEYAQMAQNAKATAQGDGADKAKAEERAKQKVKEAKGYRKKSDLADDF